MKQKQLTFSMTNNHKHVFFGWIKSNLPTTNLRIFAVEEQLDSQSRQLETALRRSRPYPQLFNRQDGEATGLMVSWWMDWCNYNLMISVCNIPNRNHVECNALKNFWRISERNIENFWGTPCRISNTPWPVSHSLHTYPSARSRQKKIHHRVKSSF